MIIRLVKKTLQILGFKIVRIRKTKKIFLDLHTKYASFTMVPKEVFISNLELVSQFNQIPGCIVECGVWRGGMIAAIYEVFGERECLLFDSFEGLPEAKEIDGLNAIAWQKNTEGDYYFDNCLAEIEFAENAMKLAEANNFKIIKGWFEDTVETYDLNNNIAVLRLDADWYESTTICLDAFYDRVSPGGLIIIDDYYTWDGCTKAVHDFLSRRKLNERIRSTISGVAYIVKT
jgi:O-methyltransferase